MSLRNRCLISTLDFSVGEQAEILQLADELIERPRDFTHLLDGKIMASLFFEPSTRTRLSFEAAMQRLGGKVVGFAGPDSSSVVKGETLSDTVRTAASYSDVIVMRHPKEGAAYLASRCCGIPVINAGDGGREHPTQTLADLMTISHIRGGIENLTVGCCGDLKFGRTVHSLVKNIGRYPGVRFVFISPGELVIPDSLRAHLLQNRVGFAETRSLEEALPGLDALYMTRVQKERFFNEEDYVRLKDSYILDRRKLRRAKDDLLVMHPLPRVNEIATEVDADPRARYFDQVKFGMYVRMALLCKILEPAQPDRQNLGL